MDRWLRVGVCTKLSCFSLASGPALLQRYKYYVVINNGMRGPFARVGEGHEQQHWTQPFINKLDNHVSNEGKFNVPLVFCCCMQPCMYVLCDIQARALA